MEFQDQKHGGKLIDRQSGSFFQFVDAHRVVIEAAAQGKLKVREDITEGFENMQDGLAKLYSGKNMGVALCRVRQDSEMI